MPSVASPKIAFYRGEYTEGLKEQIKNVFKEVHQARHRSFGTCHFFRTPSIDGEFNIGSLSNKLHRAAVHMAYYFTSPIIVNYDGAIDQKDVTSLLSEMRYTDLGRVYWVDMDSDGTYTMSLIINQNSHFLVKENVEVVEVKPLKKVY